MKPILILLSAAAILAGCSTSTTIGEKHRKAPQRIVLDSHADTPWFFATGAQMGEYDPKYMVSIPRMREGGVGAQYLACWVEQGKLTDEGRQNAKVIISDQIDSCYSQILRNDTACGLAWSTEDVYKLNSQGKIAMLIGVENGYGIGLDLYVVDEYKALGVSYITLCHIANNDICDSSSDKTGPKWHGLSDFGKEVVARMNALGIAVDLSHASEETFWDVLSETSVPVVCSHSGAAAIFKHDRNLTDEQLRAIGANGGVVQVCAVDEFLCPDASKASIDDFMAHLLHVIEVAGVDHAGIGSDFDGGGGVPGFKGSEDFVNIEQRLQQEGFSDEDITKILGGNFLRVLTEIQSSSSD